MTSFPKAKLHRFNEDTSCAPPPGTYDPKLDTKVKGAPIPKGKRFPDQYISSSMDNLDHNPSSDQIGFRTPQVTRKVKLTPRLHRNLESKFDTPGSSSAMSNDRLFKTPGGKNNISSVDYQRLEQELRTLSEKHLIEINVLNSQIVKLQDNLLEVEKREEEIKLILEEKSALAVDRHEELLIVKQNLDIVEERIRREREDHGNYIKELKEEIFRLETEKENLEEIISEKQSAIVQINERFNNVECELKHLRVENEWYREEINFIEEKNSDLLRTIEVESEEKIGQLDGALKTKLLKLETEFHFAQESAQIEFETKLDDIITSEFKVKIQDFEYQLEKYQTKVNKLLKLINQNEKEFGERIIEADERCKLIYRELCKVENERDELIVADLEKKLHLIESQEKTDIFEKELKECKEKCRKYEITLKTMQRTIDAVGDRLRDSDNEVIRLKSDKVNLELQKKVLEEKSHLLLSDILALREGMAKMENDIICDVAEMRDHLAAKVDHFKKETAERVRLLSNEIESKQDQINTLNDKLGDANSLVDELTSFKIKSDEKIKNLTYKIELYETTLCNVEEEINKLKSENIKHSDIIEELKTQIESHQEIAKKNKVREVKQQHYIDGLVSDLVLEKERCEALEIERNQVVAELSEIKLSNSEKNNEIKELDIKIGTMSRSVTNLEEKLMLSNNDKYDLRMQLLNTENSLLELKVINESISSSLQNIQREKLDLQQTFSFDKKLLNTEIKDLQDDNVNKASRILELSMAIDTLTESNNEWEVEKFRLSGQLEQANMKILELEKEHEDKSLTIKQLTDHVNVGKAKYEDYVLETQNIYDMLHKHNELIKVNADYYIQLQNSEEKIRKLEEDLKEASLQGNKSEVLLEDSQQVRDELDIVRFKLQVVTEERNKLDKELAELMGHQNIHQKIKHVNQLKQTNVELREKAERLEIENTRLKKKIVEFKENANFSNLENSPKSIKNKVKKTASPAVLKDRNC